MIHEYDLQQNSSVPFGIQFLEPMSGPEAFETLGWGTGPVNGPCPASSQSGATCTSVTINGTTTHTFDGSQD